VATCNTVGQTAGYFVGNVVFLTLESADFCNKYIYAQHETYGVVTLSGLFQNLCCTVQKINMLLYIQNANLVKLQPWVLCLNSGLSQVNEV